MKAGTDLQQAPHTSQHADSALGRRDDSSQQFQERTFSGTVPADDPDDLAGFDREVDILEGPKPSVSHSGVCSRWGWLPKPTEELPGHGFC
jgi:hypothetical protein